jgi:cyclic pyranopterin phosphate synthase
MSVEAQLDQLGRPLRDLRLSVTDRCNFRCPYCMPHTDAAPYHFTSARDGLTAAEMLRIVEAFAQLGVRKLRLTGGEPLLVRELPELIERFRRVPGIEEIALTTNGSLLAERAAALKSAGLSRVTVSLDSDEPAVFARLSGHRGDLTHTLAGVEAAQRAGLTPLKINTVVQRGVNDHAVIPLLRRFRGSGITVRFIEYMDVGNHAWDASLVVPSAELLARIAEEWPLTARSAGHGEVAELYEFADGQGHVGFISSVSAPFCGSCSRARVSATGSLYTCLFAGGGVSLREALDARADAGQLKELISTTWLARADRYSASRSTKRRLPMLSKVEMHRVGG